MPFSATARLEFINQLPLEPLDLPARSPGQKPGTPRPEMAGCKVRTRGKTAIYVIDRNGYRRLVPFPLTFMNLFKDSAALEGLLICNTISDIAEGPPLDTGAILVRGRTSEPIYILDRGRKRLITSQWIMDKYDFNEESVVIVPQSLVDAAPTGEIWE
jgi:hypothetical protein